jgi:hypothetical protein
MLVDFARGTLVQADIAIDPPWITTSDCSDQSLSLLSRSQHGPAMPLATPGGRLQAGALAVSVTEVSKGVELRRHTDADDDVLTAEGVTVAPEIGTRLRGGYDLAVSTGAQRATQTLACFLAALGQQVPGGVVVEPGLRSRVEDRWRAAYQKAGSGALAYVSITR